ncbi:expressed unknown protein [Seminavis robusta]|uniref:Uncharacterized protein n=1 Tax=Seminavis robusta TaxID=568900 RepID=A0A9N8D697_9STRA|nr:expressed unknown protein [Seminavis robusta]|eukprot:Sro16_g011880.1 n/a (157) ;mRNA; f:152250-152720
MNFTSSVLLLVVAVLCCQTVSANTNTTLLDDALAHAGHQERQYDRRELSRCIRREMMVLQNTMAQQEEDDFHDDSPEYHANDDNKQQHSNNNNELKEVTRIFTACQKEVEGGESAMGVGAKVGSFLARAVAAMEQEEREEREEPIADRSPPGSCHV